MTKPEQEARLAPANGEHTSNGTPRGYTTLTPHLAVSPARDALRFYREVFGAEVLDVTPMGELVAHAVLALENGRFTVSDPMENYGLVAPVGPSASMTLAMYVPNVDAVVERAVAAGAVLREPLSTFVSGDRYASLRDPFGVRWAVMTRVEDLSPEESNRRVAEWARGQQ